MHLEVIGGPSGTPPPYCYDLVIMGRWPLAFRGSGHQSAVRITSRGMGADHLPYRPRDMAHPRIALAPAVPGEVDREALHRDRRL